MSALYLYMIIVPMVRICTIGAALWLPGVIGALNLYETHTIQGIENLDKSCQGLDPSVE